MMKDIKKALLERRSIRRYTRDKVTQDQIDFIYEAIRKSPTSYNGQQFSVIAVQDQAIKERLYEITGQKQIKTCALFLVFCVDYHKIDVIAKAKNIDSPHYESTIDGYTVGVVDASMAMMAASVASETLGLGCCSIGYTRTSNPSLISEILGLPKGTSIVCGLTIGVPNEQPDLKPKQPVDIVVHSERYVDDDRLRDGLLSYDAEIADYNRQRSGTQTDNDWAGHIIDYHKLEIQHTIAGYLKDQLGLECEVVK